ncbi:hypothetical protein CKAN_01112000 [Cinnamomum micranthum f. kanehirae]|uniref:Uncharacterized protein n=1 Tax=Cinnamomum micranthum f. kanehirae TaxID=337451 RepID=A0A3S3MZA3_9MAGN|nr:hypothetical protein CKAN_01112000 [Cinnamomum micranthum f. kanehirae]
MARRVSVLLLLLCVAVTMAVTIPMSMADAVEDAKAKLNDPKTKEAASSWGDWAKKAFSGYDKEKAKKDAQELANKAGNMRQKSTEDIVKGAEDVMHKAGTANEKTAKDARKGAEEMAHKAGDIAKHAAVNNNA